MTDFTLYRIVDDGGRLLPVPACLMEIVDRRCSKYWQVVYNQERFSLLLEPVEFVRTIPTSVKRFWTANRAP